MRIVAGSLIAGLSLGIVGCDLLATLNSVAPPGFADPNSVFTIAGQTFRVEVVTTDLNVPWAIGFSPDGSQLFVTERVGDLALIDVASGAIISRTNIRDVADNLPRSEQGLMGLAVSPDFANDQTIYVSYTRPTGNVDFVVNTIARWRLVGTSFEPTENDILIDNIPASFVHDGLPLGFGPDGKLYASTGDANRRADSQDPNALNGKYLRFNPDGSRPDDNPFPGSFTWSLGHRNSQGFDFHPELEGVLVATEHGPSPGLDPAGGRDELNLIQRGANYGWPEVAGDETGPGFTPPIFHTGEDTIAPGGGEFVVGTMYPAWQNAFVFCGLADRQLWVAKLDPNDPSVVMSIEGGMTDAFGRLRAIEQGPDGFLYISTSNRDSRGTPIETDDRILRLVPVE